MNKNGWWLVDTIPVITWANIGQDLCHDTADLGHYGLHCNMIYR